MTKTIKLPQNKHEQNINDAEKIRQARLRISEAEIVATGQLLQRVEILEIIVADLIALARQFNYV